MSARWTSEQLKAHRGRQLDRKAAKPRKYRNEPTVIDGIRFDSKKEAEHYRGLCLLKRAGVVERIDLQVKYPLTVNGEKVGTYVADFVVSFPDGLAQVQDVKGVRTPVYKLKKRLMKAIYGIEIIEI